MNWSQYWQPRGVWKPCQDECFSTPEICFVPAYGYAKWKENERKKRKKMNEWKFTCSQEISYFSIRILVESRIKRDDNSFQSDQTINSWSKLCIVFLLYFTFFHPHVIQPFTIPFIILFTIMVNQLEFNLHLIKELIEWWADIRLTNPGKNENSRKD